MYVFGRQVPEDHTRADEAGRSAPKARQLSCRPSSHADHTIIQLATRFLTRIEPIHRGQRFEFTSISYSTRYSANVVV
jgi:uncharacterized protein (DUF1684 family)